MVSYCNHWMSVINNRFKGHLLLSYLLVLNLTEMIRIWPSLIIVQIVLVCWISRSQRIKKTFEMKTLKIVLSKTTRPSGLDSWYVASLSGPLPSLFKLYPQLYIGL